MQHHPSASFFERKPSVEQPLRVMVSACLSGTQCGYDGKSHAVYSPVNQIINSPNVKTIRFCPEHFSFGTPRALADIHGGNGFDVLDGKAKVLTEEGLDWTEPMIAAAQEMLAIAQREQAEVAILLDTSAACGSQVIYEGRRTSEKPVYQRGLGVAAALLARNGIPVLAQRDFKSLEKILKMLDPNHPIDTSRIDHHETEWYQTYFNTKA